MHQFISFNHEITLATEAQIDAVSSAGLYGKGVFTTLAITNAEPFLWEKHWRRLVDNADRLEIKLPSKKDLQSDIAKIIAANDVVRGRMRITIFDESTSGIWTFNGKSNSTVLITTGDFSKLDSIKLTFSGYHINSLSPLANMKSCNYLENIIAFNNAKNNGFDEAIRLNERGEITSGCMANIFWTKAGDIFTPSLKTGCLAGTIREYLLEKYEIFEVEEGVETLANTESIFLTSSGIGCLAVSKLNDKRLQTTLPPQLEPLPAVQP